MKSIIRLIIMTLTLLPIGCNDDDKQVLSTTPIGFTAISTESRATLVDQKEFDRAGSEFLVFADYRYNASAAHPSGYGDSIALFRSQSVVSDGNKWNYTPLQFWQQEGAYDFRAVWPSTARVDKTSTGQAMIVNYSIVTDTCDMMVAYKHIPMPKMGNNYVGLNFYHTLTAINIIIDKESNDQQSYIIKNTYFKNLYVAGNFVHTQSPETSEALYRCWRTSYFENSKNIHEQTHNKEVPRTLGYNFMIPQEVNPAGTPDEKKAKLCYTLNINGTESATETELPYIKWLPGNKYTYRVIIKGSDAKIEVITTKWDEVDILIDDIIGKIE